MAIDASTGIYLFEGTEQFQPLSTTLNLLANSTKSSVANLQALVQAIQAFGGNEYENSGRVVAQRGRTGFTTAGRYITDREYLLTASNVNVSSSQVSGADAPWNITWTTTSATNSCKIVQSYEYFKVLMWRGTTRTFSRYLSTSSSGVNVTVAIEYTTNSQDSVGSGTWTVLNSTTAAPGTSGNWIDVTGTIPATATNLRLTVSTTNIASGVTVTDRMPLWVKGNQRGIYAPQSPTVTGELANANRHFVSDDVNFVAAKDVFYNYLAFQIRLPAKMRTVPTVTPTACDLAGHHSILPAVDRLTKDTIVFSWNDASGGVRDGGRGTIAFVASAEL